MVVTQYLVQGKAGGWGGVVPLAWTLNLPSSLMLAEFGARADFASSPLSSNQLVACLFPPIERMGTTEN